MCGHVHVCVRACVFMLAYVGMTIQRVTGRGWVWLLSSQAVASLIQAQEADLSLILQGSVAAVPAGKFCLKKLNHKNGL